GDARCAHRADPRASRARDPIESEEPRDDPDERAGGGERRAKTDPIARRDRRRRRSEADPRDGERGVQRHDGGPRERRRAAFLGAADRERATAKERDAHRDEDERAGEASDRDERRPSLDGARDAGERRERIEALGERAARSEVARAASVAVEPRDG